MPVNIYHPNFDDPMSIAKAMALGADSRERVARSNLYNIQAQEAQNKLNEENMARQARSLYDAYGTAPAGSPQPTQADMQQMYRDQGIPGVIGQQVANQAMQAQQSDPRVQAQKDWISKTAIGGYTMQDPAQYQEYMRAAYRAGQAQGIDFSRFGIKSEDDMAKVPKDNLLPLIMDQKVLEQINEHKMDIMLGGKLNPEQQLIRTSLVEKLGRNPTAKEILDETDRRKASAQSLKLSVNGLTEVENSALNKAIAEGRLDPYKVNSRTAKIFAQQEMQQPGTLNFNELGAQAGFQRAIPTSQTKALLNTIDPLLDKLDSAGKALGNMKSPAVNKVVNWAKENVTGDPNLTAFKNLRDDTVAEIERGLMNTGVLSDSKYNRAIRNVSEAANYQQLQEAIKNTRTVIHARLEALQTGPYPNAAQAPKGQVAPITATNPKTGQKIKSLDGGKTWQAM